jgi:CRISPR-associated protein Cmr2
MEKFFKAKAWALLHDPPHKMWAILNLAKYGDERPPPGEDPGKHKKVPQHEKEAVCLWHDVGLAQHFGPITTDKQISDLVKEADQTSSTMDRWFFDQIRWAIGEREVLFKYMSLHNIFDPSLKIELPEGVNIDKVCEFAQEIKKILDNLEKGDENYKLAYHLFYSLYELMWIQKGLPPSLAETRIPTHTVFDHLYATASVVNMLRPKGDEVGGYLVEIDIPQIQRVVNAARKAGDFWAGSWLVSMLTWLTAWPFVWKYGPDVMIKPTLRLNPTYLYTLSSKLSRQETVYQSFKSAVESFFSFWGAESLEELMTVAFIPSTVLLLLPPDAEKEVQNMENAFGDVQRVVLDWALTGAVDCGGIKDELARESCVAFRDMFVDAESTEEIFLKVASKTRESLGRELFADLISVRVTAVDLRQVYSCVKEFVVDGRLPKECEGEGVTEEGLRRAEKFVNALKQLQKKHKKEEGLRRTPRHLAFDVALEALAYRKRSGGRRKLVLGKSWFNYGSAIPLRREYGRYVFYRRVDSGFIYCSTCGAEPAIIHLPRHADDPHAYSSEAKEMLSREFNLNDKEVEELVKQMRPGEALGPFCLAKRALYYRFASWYAKRHGKFRLFDSTEDVAFAWYIERLYTKTDLTGKPSDVELKAVAEYLNAKRKDIAIICRGVRLERCTAEQARQIFNKVVSKHLADATETAYARLREDLESCIEAVRIGDDILHFRGYFAVVKGDGDNVGRLNRGLIDLNNYVAFLRELREAKGTPEELRAVYDELVNILTELQQGGLGVLVTPTYYAAFSMSLMITALKDVRQVAEYKGQVIYAGGDDVLALLPAETALVATRNLRDNYWGDETGFHKVRDFLFAAPRLPGLGRSFSVRYVNIMDIMSAEIKEATRLLEKKAKKIWWDFPGFRSVEKDAVVVSESRTEKFAVLPLTTPKQLFAPRTPHKAFSVLNVLNRLFVMRLGGALSGNLPEDYERYREVVERVDCRSRVVEDAWSYVVGRNAAGEDAKRLLSLDVLENYGVDRCAKASSEGGFLLTQIVKAYEILRGYP